MYLNYSSIILIKCMILNYNGIIIANSDLSDLIQIKRSTGPSNLNKVKFNCESCFMKEISQRSQTISKAYISIIEKSNPIEDVLLFEVMYDLSSSLSKPTATLL